MARITTYSLDSNISLNDKLVGSDSDDNSATKNYSIDALGDGLISLKSITTGSGITNTLPIWTDGPNGVLGDSRMVEIGYAIQVGTPGTGQQPTLLGDSFITVEAVGTTQLTVDNISAQQGGTVSLIGNVIIGDQATDILQISSSVSDYTGTASAAAGQVLVSNASSQLEWDDATDIVSGAITKLIPTIIVASANDSSTYSGNNNIVELQWTGGNGTYTLNIPSATAIPYRVIRFVTDGTFPGGASHKINITAQAGEAIDGDPDFEISKVYEGVSIWSTGTEWIVIQAKAH